MAIIIFLFGLFIFSSFFLFGYSFIKKYNLPIQENILFSIIISSFIFLNLSIFLLLTNFYYNYFLQTFIFLFFLFGLKNIFYIKIIYKQFLNFFKDNKLFIIIIFIQATFFLIGSSLFPLGEDALSYHLSLPKIFLSEHKFVDRGDILNSTYPLNSELLYAIGLSLNLPEISNIINWFFYLLLILLIYHFSMILFQNKKISYLSVFIFITTPSIFRIIGYCKNDIILVFFCIATIFIFWKILNHFNRIYNILFILSFSILLGIKYHSLFFLIIFSVIILTIYIYSKFEIKRLKIFLFIIISLFLASFWYIKNFIIVNNPVYPFLDSYFNKSQKKIIIEKDKKIYINPRAIRHFSELRKYEKSFKNYLKFLYDLTINFQYFDFWKYSIGPLYLIFFILLLFNLKIFDIKILFLFFIIFSYITFIYLLAPRGRFLLPILPLFAILCSRAIQSFDNSKIIKYLSIIIISITLLINLLLTFAQNFFKIPAFLGIEKKDVYIKKSLYYYKGFYDVILYSNKNLNPKSDKILLMINKGFLLDIPFILGFDYMFTRYIIPYNEFLNENEFINYLKKLNITHIIYTNNLDRFVNKNFYIYIKKLIDNKKIKIIYQKEETFLIKIL